MASLVCLRRIVRGAFSHRAAERGGHVQLYVGIYVCMCVCTHKSVYVYTYHKCAYVYTYKYDFPERVVVVGLRRII